MPETVELSSILAKLADAVKSNVPGRVDGFAIDLFVDRPTFMRLKEANPIAYSESEEESSLDLHLGEWEILIMETGSDE